MNEKLIREFLKGRGVHPFWIDSALSWISRVLAGNDYFVRLISNPTVTTKARHIVKFECDAITVHPDSNREATARIVYTFNARTGHKATISGTTA